MNSRVGSKMKVTYMFKRQRKVALGLAIVGLLSTVVACDPFTKLDRRIVFPGSFPLSCIEEAAGNLSDLDHFKRLPLPRSQEAADNYVFGRRSAAVGLLVYSAPKHEWVLHFGWVGYRDKHREAEHMQLLNDVQDALMQACGLSREQITVVDEWK
jgi:hypothetical protein